MKIRAIRNAGHEVALRKPLWLNIFVPVIPTGKAWRGCLQ
jgi:hypothetical protein